MIAPLREIGMIGGENAEGMELAQRGKSEIGVFFPAQAANDLKTPED
jgi:hypothetical protein